MLIQRSFVQAQGLGTSPHHYHLSPLTRSAPAGTHDLIAATGILEADGPIDGTEIPLSSIPETESSDPPPVWSRQYKGEIKLGPSVGSSFRAPNLIVTFLVAIRVKSVSSYNVSWWTVADLLVVVVVQESETISNSIYQSTSSLLSVQATQEATIFLHPPSRTRWISYSLLRIFTRQSEIDLGLREGGL